MVNDLLDGLGLVLLHPIKEQKFRSSIASSVSTFMTTDSAEVKAMKAPYNCHCPSQIQIEIGLISKLSSDFGHSEF